MKKIQFLIIILFLFTITILSGCNESESITVDQPNNIFIDSELVELIEGELVFNKIREVVKRVEVKYRFRNLQNKKIDLNVYAEFFDNQGNLISKEGPKEISLLPNYVEQSYGGANSIIFDDVGVKNVNYVRLIVEERFWILKKIN